MPNIKPVGLTFYMEEHLKGFDNSKVAELRMQKSGQGSILYSVGAGIVCSWAGRLLRTRDCAVYSVRHERGRKS